MTKFFTLRQLTKLRHIKYERVRSALRRRSGPVFERRGPRGHYLITEASFDAWLAKQPAPVKRRPPARDPLGLLVRRWEDEAR